MEKKKIAIIGNGKIGEAISFLLKSNLENNDHFLEIFDKTESKNESRKTLKECISGSDLLFLCVPSWVLEEIFSEIKGFLEKKTILISIAKGISLKTKRTIPEMIEKTFQKQKYALLSGPMFTNEIMEKKISYGVLATKKRKDYEKIKKLFSSTKLKLEYEKKTHSVAMVAVLKNIYTLLLAMIEDYGEKNNTKGYLSAKAITEMIQIMQILKLDKRVVLGTAGMGDFIGTSSSEYSQNKIVGKEIFNQGKSLQKSEGLVSLSALIKKLGKKTKDLPLLSLLEKIIIEKKLARKEIEKFLERI